MLKRVTLTGLRNIVRGWYRRLFVKPEPFTLERLAVCKDCAFNTKNKKGLAYKVFPAVCSLCKCDLKAKASLPGIACPFGKWQAITSREELINKLLEDWE